MVAIVCGHKGLKLEQPSVACVEGLGLGCVQSLFFLAVGTNILLVVIIRLCVPVSSCSGAAG